jgi:TonB family protein
MRLSNLLAAAGACSGIFATAALAQDGGATVTGPPELQPVVVQGYPELALQRRQEGDVRFRTTIDGDGKVASCQVIESSGSEELDASTCRLITRFAKFNRQPSGQLSNTIEGRVSWRLPANLPPIQTAEALPPLPVKVVCQTIQEGQWKLSRSRVCLSAEQWKRIARENEQGFNDHISLSRRGSVSR